MAGKNTGLIIGGGLSIFICCLCLISSVVIGLLYMNGFFDYDKDEDKDIDEPITGGTTTTGSTTTGSTTGGTTQDNLEVFHLKGYDYTYPQGIEACKLYNNSVLATKTQLEDAHKNGAHWWSAGWIADLSGQRLSQYPLQQSGEGVINGINTFGVANTEDVTSKAGVNCYGKKPADTTDNRTKIAEFNTITKKWSQFI
jgi:hypothetical protein